MARLIAIIRPRRRAAAIAVGCGLGTGGLGTMRGAAVMSAILGMVVGLGVAGLAGDTAMAAEPSLKRRAKAAGFWGDQRGCYWRRGDRVCSRLCYWEFNGRRYCTERERTAYPQGDPRLIPLPPEPPIYLRPAQGRP